MDALAQYMEKNDDGFVEMRNLRLILLGQYKHEPEQPKAKQAPIEADTDLTDILLPIKTELTNRGILPPDLFDIYDEDKNYLLSSEELIDVMENFTGYRLTEREH